ncbi:ABC transporter permease [Pseudonocardia sp. T1-2H]|uniref:ABC transporter permease n=1 Tax=Pseudonocardia sp. T1-2H TaxID=3128899 RepID=UPI0031013A10
MTATASLDAREAISAPEQSARARFLRRFRRQVPGLIALGYLVLVVLSALCAPLLATHDPLQQNLSGVLQPPGGGHVLGTDDLGRDVFSRALYAGRISLLAAAQAVAVAVVLGVVPGLIAGYAGRRVDAVIMRVTDALMSFPPLILAIAFVGVLGPSLTNAMFVIGVIFAPRFVRLVRGTVLSIREETFIEASRSIGTPTARVIRRHVLPNALSPLIVQISLTAAMAMLAEASLSFLGLGVQPPDASWGSMIERGFRYTAAAPWLTIFPGLLIALTVLAFNLLGDGLRDSLGRETRRGS